jgi:hypothetical protein
MRSELLRVVVLLIVGVASGCRPGASSSASEPAPTAQALPPAAVEHGPAPRDPATVAPPPGPEEAAARTPTPDAGGMMGGPAVGAMAGALNEAGGQGVGGMEGAAGVTGPPAPPAPADTPEAEALLQGAMTFDWLRPGTDETEIMAWFGAHSERHGPVGQGGVWEVQAIWEHAGLQTLLRGESEDGPWRVRNFSLFPPSQLRNEHGRGVGTEGGGLDQLYRAGGLLWVQEGFQGGVLGRSGAVRYFMDPQGILQRIEVLGP